jgi:serine/threonine-protein kinase ULK2
MASMASPGAADNKNAIIIKEVIGAGQFGTVHLAETTEGELRAVKKIAVSSMRTQRHVQNLDREIKILKDIDHPNIVKLYAVKKRGEEFWLILEYCGGGDLAGYLKDQPKKRMPELVVLHFFKQLASGLFFMSEKGLIHRDLKPANLLLSERSNSGVIKIADFGFARELAGSGMALTQCGSPLYMAPEILSGQPHDLKVSGALCILILLV